MLLQRGRVKSRGGIQQGYGGQKCKTLLQRGRVKSRGGISPQAASAPAPRKASTGPREITRRNEKARSLQNGGVDASTGPREITRRNPYRQDGRHRRCIASTGPREITRRNAGEGQRSFRVLLLQRGRVKSRGGIHNPVPLPQWPTFASTGPREITRRNWQGEIGRASCRERVLVVV